MGVCTDMMRQQAGNAPLPVGIDFQMAAGQSSNRRNQQPADNDARYKWDRVGPVSYTHLTLPTKA